MIALASCVEPLRAANHISGKMLYDWSTVSVDGEGVTASNGLRLVPDESLCSMGGMSPLIVCAGLGLTEFRNAAALARLRELARSGVQLGGVCTGALPLARAGLLDGYRCTIHWENVESFVEEFPDLDITATLFEVDRNRFTCSGGTAPLDMMVSAVSHDHGEDLGIQVAEFLLHHSVRHPHEFQRLSLRYRTGISHPKLLAVIAHMEAYIESPVPLSELGRSAGLSNRQLERLFRENLNKTPSRYYLELRLRRARLLIQQSSMTILQVAVATGFTSSSHFARCYRSYFGMPPRNERSGAKRIA